MDRELIRAELKREPFVPFRLRLTNGKHFDVPFRDVAHIIFDGVLVFKGLKEGTIQAKGYDRFGFDYIDRIEPLRKKKHKKKKS